MSAPATARALVGVSACLLGEEVRYDGDHKLDDFVSGALARIVELRPVCPEVDIGLGVPREPIRLESSGNGTRLVASESGTDLTAAMRTYAEAKVRELDTEGICGYVLKSRSPSCGLENVPVAGGSDGSGLFTAALSELCELLPLVEETGLVTDDAREVFLAQVLAYRRLRDLFDGEWAIDQLVDHHTCQKLLLMAYSPELCPQLGRLVAEAADDDPAEVEESYRRLTMEAFSQRPDTGWHSNALDHMRGYLREKISTEEYDELESKIEEYRRGELLLGEVLDVFRHLVRENSVDYLTLQTYLGPQPAELLVAADH